MKKPINPRFLKHIELTKAKPHPIAKRGVQVRGRSLADLLGVSPDTKMTSLPISAPEAPPVVSRETSVEPGPENPPVEMGQP